MKKTMSCFKRETLAKQNGHPQRAQNGIAGESIEMIRVDNAVQNKSDSPTVEELNLVKFKVIKRATTLWRTRVSCFVLLLVLVLLLGLTLAFIVPYFRNVEKLVIHHIRTRGWNTTFEDTGKFPLHILYVIIILHIENSDNRSESL